MISTILTRFIEIIRAVPNCAFAFLVPCLIVDKRDGKIKRVNIVEEPVTNKFCDSIPTGLETILRDLPETNANVGFCITWDDIGFEILHKYSAGDVVDFVDNLMSSMHYTHISMTSEMHYVQQASPSGDVKSKKARFLPLGTLTFI